MFVFVFPFRVERIELLFAVEFVLYLLTSLLPDDRRGLAWNAKQVDRWNNRWATIAHVTVMSGDCCVIHCVSAANDSLSIPRPP